MKIESLSELQIERLGEFREKWLKIGLCTAETNKARAEQAVRDAYRIAGLEEPKMILWAQSPIGLLMTAKLIKEIAKEGFKPYSEMNADQVGDQVWDQVGDQVGAQVWAQVWDQVGDQVRAQVGAQGLKQEWNEVYSWGAMGFFVASLLRLLFSCLRIRVLREVETINDFSRRNRNAFIL